MQFFGRICIFAVSEYGNRDEFSIVITMNRFSENDIKKKLKKLYWDYPVTGNDLYEVFIGDKKNIGSIDRRHIYGRLLASYDWYALLEMVPRQQWKVMLSDQVLAFLFPASLKNKYKYARKILFG